MIRSLALCLALFAAAPAAAFEFKDGDHVVLIGSTLIEREQRYGYWEAAITAHYPERKITFRNLGWSGDTVWGEARAGFGNPAEGYKHLIDHVRAEKPTVIIVGYGTNESFAGEAGLEKFQVQLKKLLDDVSTTKARLVLLAPMKMVKMSQLPDPAKANANLELYGEAIKDEVGRRGAQFYRISGAHFDYDSVDQQKMPPVTENGMHLTVIGYAFTSLDLTSLDRASLQPIMIDANSRRFQAGDTNVKTDGASLRFKVTMKTLLQNSSLVEVKGLGDDTYAMLIDGKRVRTASAKEWARLGRIDGSPQLTQFDQLRRAIIAKNELYFHRWRPQNVTYLFGFRKHEQGQNAREIPQFDPLVAAKEKEIAELKKPRQHVYELVRVDEEKKPPTGGNWPQFRGTEGNGLSDSRGLPITWSEKENIRWKTAIHDKGWSSPVIWGNQVWMTTATEDGKEYFAVCVDRSSGKIVHDIKLFTDDKPAYCHPYNSYASPTPVVEEGRLYVHFGSHGTACLDTATGSTLWLRRDLPCYHHRGAGSSPIVWKNLLILTFDGFDQQYVTALDKSTGKTVWKKNRNIEYGTDDGDLKKAYSTPSVFVVDGKPQLVSPAAAATIAYDPASGDEIWRVYHGGMNEAVQPVFGHGFIYLSSGHIPSILAVRAGGTGDLTQEGIAWKSLRGAPSRPTPLLLGELLFMISDQGVATCLEAKTGKLVWQERLGKATCASPVHAEGRVYFADEDGKTCVVSAQREFKLLATNKLDAGCMASPAIAGDALFLRTKTHLYCIGK